MVWSDVNIFCWTTILFKTAICFQDLLAFMSWLKSKAFGSWRRGTQLRNQLWIILSWQTNTSALSRCSSRSSSRSVSRQSSISSVPSQPAGSGRNTPNLVYTGRTHTPPPPSSILQHPKTTRYGQLTLNIIRSKNMWQIICNKTDGTRWKGMMNWTN